MQVTNALARRLFLIGFASTLLVGASSVVYAEDGNDSEDSSDNGDSGDSGEDSEDGGGGSGDQGSGSSGSGSSGSSNSDQNKAQDAVKNGAAMPLAKAFDLLSARYPGRVIEVQLVKRYSGFDYKFKVIDDAGNVTLTSMDAVTGRFRNRFGF